MSTGVAVRTSLRMAVQGCGHGMLNQIYERAEEDRLKKGWDSLDLVVVGGDFQAVRNSADLECVAMPPKYRTMADFHEYYSGARKAPYLTIYVGGNHEASNYHSELFYGGWVAPNIYYLGGANVVRLGGVRIGGLSGIWKGYSYRKRRHERLPYANGEDRSVYHQRETDVRKLFQLATQLDVVLSHDWPRAVEWAGNWRQLFRCKAHFEQESREGTLGSVAGRLLLDRLRPYRWFSAHMHVRFAASVEHKDDPEPEAAPGVDREGAAGEVGAEAAAGPEGNPDEIDLDMDDDGEQVKEVVPAQEAIQEEPAAPVETQPDSLVPEDVRSQLPASFLQKKEPTQTGDSQQPSSSSSSRPKLPVPAGITNKRTEFLALDKCLPRRHFLELVELALPAPVDASTGPLRLSYDPEWLAITKALAPEFDAMPPSTGPADVAPVPERSHEEYAALVAEARAWVDEKVVAGGGAGGDGLLIPENFEVTAPTYPDEQEELARGARLEVKEYLNPQTSAFCRLLDIPNPCEAPPPVKMSARRDRDDGDDGGDAGGRPDRKRFQGRPRGSRGGHGRGRGAHRGRGFGRGRA